MRDNPYFKPLMPVIRTLLGNMRFAASLSLCLMQACSKDPSPALSPAQALQSFELADPELQISLVASEPLIEDPVVISFDEAGRLWVVEMLGFMRDIDGKGELDPLGRVSILTDEDGDGEMDAKKIYMDSLVLPRALAVVEGGALVAENIPLWFAPDKNKDLAADGRISLDTAYGGLGMPEHSANGLWRGLDNWYYNAKSRFRYRKEGKQWVRGETEFRGQWGICHDNAGRLFYNYNWSQLHADLVPPNALLNNPNHSPTTGIDHGLTLERKIFPIRSNTAVNRGYVPGTLDADGKLLEFASACGPLVYRGTALPPAYLGDAFVCEPTANLIKQNNIFEDGFMLRAESVYENREFLASTDERFRPISLASGPDGALYVVDMYKGVIQHGPYMTPYLREISLKRKLDRPVHMGRIWKISAKENKGSPAPTPITAKNLPALLGHPNGWTRDMAQRLLVEAADTTQVAALINWFGRDNALGQLHALWTLEGLGHRKPQTYFQALHGKDPVVRQSALRILHTLFPEQPQLKDSLEKWAQDHFEEASPLVRMQLILISDAFSPATAFELAERFLAAYGPLPLARDVVMSSLENREFALFTRLMTQPLWASHTQNREIFLELLTTAITNRGKEAEIQRLLTYVLPMADSSSWKQAAILNGMMNFRGAGEDARIELASRPPNVEQLTHLEGGRLLDLMHWPGKPRPAKSTEPKADRALFAEGRQHYLNLCASCHGTGGEGMPRFAPPLRKSEWVTGDANTLAMILLHGMEGPVTVNGKVYGFPDILPEMPSFSTLQDEEIAAIATYIRNAWGHSETEVSERVIGGIRFRTQGKINPWTAGELDTLNFDPDQ